MAKQAATFHEPTPVEALANAFTDMYEWEVLHTSQINGKPLVGPLDADVTRHCFERLYRSIKSTLLAALDDEGEHG